MKEFGSDFNTIDGYQTNESSLIKDYKNVLLMANGRQCIEALIRILKWKRLWMPEYFCYNIIEYLQKNTGIDIVFYNDYPGNDDEMVISNLNFQDGDVLFRMNYFGLRYFRSEKQIPIPVIEDHSHDLTGDWATNSDADWCIASLRKVIPIPEGGILWSPKGHSLDFKSETTRINDELAFKRWRAMDEKDRYLRGKIIDKESFRLSFVETEDTFDVLDMSSIDKRSMEFLQSFDLSLWNSTKKRNWEILVGLASNNRIKVLRPERDDMVPFSLIILFENEMQQERIRRELISSSIYPAVLWHVPDHSHDEVRSFSKRMLSIHCDGRYKEKDIEELYNTINTIIRND